MTTTSRLIPVLASAFDRLIHALAIGALVIGALLTLVLSGLGAAEVLASRLLGGSIPSAFEYQEVLMGTIVFSGLASVQLQRRHIVVDLLTSKARGRVKALLDVFATACTTLLFALLAHQSWKLASRSLAVEELSPGYVAFPLYAVKLFVFACVAVAFLACVRDLAVRVMRAFRR